jgi:hypothetical protein
MTFQFILLYSQCCPSMRIRIQDFECSLHFNHFQWIHFQMLKPYWNLNLYQNQENHNSKTWCWREGEWLWECEVKQWQLPIKEKLVRVIDWTVPTAIATSFTLRTLREDWGLRSDYSRSHNHFSDSISPIRFWRIRFSPFRNSAPSASRICL